MQRKTKFSVNIIIIVIIIIATTTTLLHNTCLRRAMWNFLSRLTNS